MKVFRLHSGRGAYNMSGKNIFGFILFLVIQQAMADDQRSTNDIMRSLMRDYQKSDPPNVDKPTEVKMGMYLNGLSVDTEKKQMSVAMYFRNEWNDPRLKFDPENGVNKINAPTDMIDSLWKPDLFFRNIREAEFRNVPSTQKLATISSNGEVWYVSSIAATFSCAMRLQKYPFDTQRCVIMIESFQYKMDTLYFSWLSSPIDIDSGQSVSGYEVTDTILSDCSQNYTAGAFPCHEVGFTLKRTSGEFIKQYYMPSILIVILSWMAFWSRPNDSTARVLPGFLLILALMLLAHAARGPLAGIFYVTALDIWMGACVLMVFFSILQSSAVYYLYRKNENEEKEVSGRTSLLPEKIDFFSRIIFPCVFLLFNIIYWSVYA